jgi:predicted enzyme related to lactoylglutathione lyase
MSGMNTVCHVEFDCSDLERSQRFYEGLFGWKFRAFTDEMVVFGTDDGHVGGLMRVNAVSPGGTPSVWFKVPDVAAYVSKAPSLGGSVLREKSELPHVGWSAQVADPDGNPVGLVQFAEA